MKDTYKVDLFCKNCNKSFIVFVPNTVKLTEDKSIKIVSRPELDKDGDVYQKRITCPHCDNKINIFKNKGFTSIAEFSKDQIQERIVKYGKDYIDSLGYFIYHIDLKSKSVYSEWLIAEKKYKGLMSKAIYQTSDENISVNIGAVNFSKAERLIDGLPIEEKNLIKGLRKDIARARGKALGLSLRSFRAKKSAKGIRDGSILVKNYSSVLDLFSKLYSTNEVHRILVNKLDINVSKKAISTFRTRFAEEIRIGQEKYKDSYDGIRLVHKRSRLEELLDLYNKRRELYISNEHGQTDYKLLLQTLEQIRKEVEGDRVIIDANLQIKIEQTISLKQEEILREIPVKTMIISMIAGRLGINPLQLLTRLTNSYYKDFNGMNSNQAVFNSSDIIYPSQIIYNLEEVKSFSIKNKEEDIELTKFEDLSNEEVESLSDVKESILDKLKKRKKELKKKKSIENSIDGLSVKSEKVKKI